MTFELRVTTWNLNGLDTTRLDTRTEAAATELVLGMSVAEAMRGALPPPLPHVICLQEVVKRAHTGHLRPHLSAAGFSIHPTEPRRDEGDYSVICVRPPWRVTGELVEAFAYSPLGRERVEVAIEDGAGAAARVITGHLESLRSGGEARVEQAREIAELLASPGPPAVFAGDTNLRRAETDALPATLRDAFDLAGAPRAHRDTWWPEESDRGMRFDRVWLPARSPLSVARFATRRRPSISDHAALDVTLRG